VIPRRRTRYATLSELDGDGAEPYTTEAWDKGQASFARLRGGSKDESPVFTGTADQCGTCHQRQDKCVWAQTGMVGPHPR